MKNVILKMAMCALIVCALPTAIVAQDWQTSSMQGSGSTYSSQVTPVGATNVQQQASTTYGPARAISGRRDVEGGGGHGDPGSPDPNSPIGSEWALLLFAAIAAGVVILRRKRQAQV